jgi:carbamoyl-phosphate synthase large subunit
MIAAAFRNGWSVRQIHDETAIDTWLLEKLQNLMDMEDTIASKWHLASSADRRELLKSAKRAGISDARMAELLGLGNDPSSS